MAIDPSWPIVEFVIAGFGLKTKDARKLIEEIPQDRYSRLVIQASAWKRDSEARAAEMLRDVVGDEELDTLHQLAKMAQSPSTDREGSSGPQTPTRSSSSRVQNRSTRR